MGACLNSGQNNAEPELVIKSDTIDVVSQYKFGRTLGSGESASVVEASHKEHKEDLVAIKIMEKTKKGRDILYKREVTVFEQLIPDVTNPPPGILPFKAHGEDKDAFYIVTGLLEGGELFDRIVSREDEYKINERIAFPLVGDMLRAVKYCHDHHIIHRDLKPENFVFVDKTASSPVVLIDFGRSRYSTEPEEVINDVAGTPDYMAPCLAAAILAKYRRMGKSISDAVPAAAPRTAKILKAADVWAMGVIAYVMVTGQAPFYGNTNLEIYESICVKGVEFPFTDVRYQTALHLGDHFKDFIRKCLIKDPFKRISIEEAIRHPWVQGVNAENYRMNEEVAKWLRQFNYQSKLKREVTRVLGAAMKGDVAKPVLTHFKRLDRNGDDYLGTEELINLLLYMGYAKSEAKIEAKAMIEAADRNDDDRIDFEEFKQVYYRKILSTNDRYIHRVFSVFDKNGDGFIDVNELKAIMVPGGRVSEEPILNTIQKIIGEVDENHDGKIAFGEFKKAMKEDIEAGKLAFGGDGDGNVDEDDAVNK
eukprot:171382_1